MQNQRRASSQDGGRGSFPPLLLLLHRRKEGRRVFFHARLRFSEAGAVPVCPVFREEEEEEEEEKEEEEWLNGERRGVEEFSSEEGRKRSILDLIEPPLPPPSPPPLLPRLSQESPVLVAALSDPNQEGEEGRRIHYLREEKKSLQKKREGRDGNGPSRQMRDQPLWKKMRNGERNAGRSPSFFLLQQIFILFLHGGST